MRGQWVPEHFAVSMEVHKAEALGKLLKEMDEDGQFPLNELEQEVVDELTRMIDEHGPSSVPQ